MKKYLTLLCMLIIGTLNIGGCGRAEADFETSVFKISDDITKVNVEHYVSGEIAQWAVEGAGVDDLRNWFNGLEFYSFTFAEEDNPEFSYVINGPEDCYLLMEGRWYLVKNPLEPPISDK